MNEQTTLDTLEPKHLETPEGGPLTLAPSSERLPGHTGSSPKQERRKAYEETKSLLREKGIELAGKTREALRERSDQAANTAASHLRCVEKQSREFADRLSDDDPSYLAAPMREVSKGVSNLADYFETRSSTEILEDGREFVRRNTGLVLGGLLAAGFLAGRFLKSSERNS